MTVNPDTTIRKLISLPRELAREIEDYRFQNRIQTESEAIRILIREGLRTADQRPVMKKL